MQTCPTCLEPLSSGSINYTVSTPCGHLFHMNCVQSWISRGNQTCPQCRSNISKEKLLRIYLQPVESETQNPHEAVEIQRNYENAPKNPSSNSVAYSRETDFVYLASHNKPILIFAESAATAIYATNGRLIGQREYGKGELAKRK